MSQVSVLADFTLFEVPLFAAATFAIIILGERNLFSRQVLYDNENIANVGKFDRRLPAEGLC